LKAVIHKQLPTLQSNVIDTNTIVNIWGCGIGTNPIMNIAIRKCFTDELGKQARINSSKKFIVFKRQADSGIVRMIKANYWPYFFRRGYRPSQSEISRTLEKQYPNALVNFNEAIDENSQSSIYHESFHIPISWTVIYKTKDQRPSVDAEADKMKWVKSQKGLMKKIEEFGIPIDQYNWTVNKIIHTDQNGNVVPAIKAIGMSTIICVLKEEGNV